MLNGRKRIYTDEKQINIGNVRKIVLDALVKHERNAIDIESLFKIAKGEMELVRKKEIRPEIDINAIDPIASQIIDFKVGFEHGTPINYIQRANIDSANPNGSIEETRKDDLRIATLNEMMREIDKAGKDLTLAEHIKKCGVGYRLVTPSRKRNAFSAFDILILNPLRTFIIYSNDVYCRKMASVTYTVTENTAIKKFGVYTDESYFEFDNTDNSPVSETVNEIGINPIVEYDNNDDIMGSFEKEIPLIDALNVVTSDRVNDICQTVQSILWLHNTKLDEQQKEALVDGGVIQTQQTAEGKDAKIQYINAPLNQTEIQTLASSLKERILESAGVPKLSEASNTTGEAMRVTNGWHTAETQAKISELMWRASEDETLEICLEFIKKSNMNPNDVATLSLRDIDYKMYRSENYDIVSRVNAFATLVNMGADLVKSAAYCKITDDPEQFIMDSKDGIDKIRFSANEKVEIEDKTVESIQPDTVAF